MTKISQLIGVLFLLTLSLHSQTGKITGKIIDAKTGETLPGATVVIDGTTKGASADFDGNYTIAGIQPGIYNLVVSYITYTTKKLAGVSVKENDVTSLNITLDQTNEQSLEGVTVQAEMNKENTNTLFVMQKNNASVSDGISAEIIKRTPDRSTSDVLKRVSGASIQDNKFAVIRGMNDRYNVAYLNGTPLPSSESDKKAFAFDIFPAGILDNLVILKTATPELPGDFAGGVILLTTKNIPEKNSTSVSFSMGYNPLTTFKNFKTYEGGKTDWLGLDDGTRQLPNTIPSTQDYSKVTDNTVKIENAKKLDYKWGLENKTALPNVSLQVIQANIGKLFSKDLGSIFAVTYNATNSTTFTNRREFEEQSTTVSKIRDYTDTVFSNTILSSVLWNLSYKLNDNHQLGLKNLFSINTDDKTTTRKGAFDLQSSIWEKSNVRWFTQNTIYTGQLNGDHLFYKGKVKFKWIGGYSHINRSIPNLRKMVYQKSSALEADSIPYVAVIQEQNVYTNSAGSMFFANTKETVYSFKYDASTHLDFEKVKTEIKLGGFHQIRTRDFDARLLGYTYYRKGSQILPYSDSLGKLSENQIFNSTNMGIIDGPGKYDGGFKLSEATSNLDSYKAGSVLNAAYIMADSRIAEKFRLIYGVRMEAYKQLLTTYDLLNNKIENDTLVIDFLPSINAVWSVTDKINIRAAYYKTVSRPEFRELAPFNFYDFVTDFSLSGNSALKRATINNYDLRFEFYPAAGQILSTSLFYKDITDAIEQISNTASQIRSLTYVNVAKVRNAGIEVEYRIKLSTLFKNDSSSWLSNVTAFTNFSYINSKVDVSKIVGAEERPLQGQSPVIINGGVQYNDDKRNFNIALSYNFVGRRIVIVGTTDEPTFWENPRHVLDFQVAKTFKDKLELKLNIKDVLAQRLIYYQDINKNNKLDKNSETLNKELNHASTIDNIMVNTRLAPTITLGISYRFN